MTTPFRSHASVRSYFFREAVYDCEPHLAGRFERVSDFRPLWRKADAKAREWRRRATTIFNPATRQWEQRQ